MNHCLTDTHRRQKKQFFFSQIASTIYLRLYKTPPELPQKKQSSILGFCTKEPKDSPQGASMYIWSRGSVFDEGGPGIEGEMKVNLQDTSVALAI